MNTECGCVEHQRQREAYERGRALANAEHEELDREARRLVDALFSADPKAELAKLRKGDA